MERQSKPKPPRNPPRLSRFLRLPKPHSPAKRCQVASSPLILLERSDAVQKLAAIFLLALLALSPAVAQSNDSATLAAIANQAISQIPAKKLFGAQKTPANMAARSFGTYARGCLAGATALPVNGPTWQVMRLSRNRNWGHPNLVQFLERLSERAHKIGWNGLLVGDMSQPRGGPMLTGHASHQVGLDADIWLTPMPDRELTRVEREETSATMMVAPDRKDVDANVWAAAHTALIKAAAEEPEVERIFVNAAIKKALC